MCTVLRRFSSTNPKNTQLRMRPAYKYSSIRYTVVLVQLHVQLLHVYEIKQVAALLVARSRIATVTLQMSLRTSTAGKSRHAHILPPTQKNSLSLGPIRAPPTYDFLGPQSPHPKQHLNRFTAFAGFRLVTNRHIGRQTDKHTTQRV